MSRSTTLGPTMPAFDRYASSTMSRAASGSSTTSSWQKSRKTAPSTDGERFVGGRGEPRSRRAAPDERARERVGDPIGRVFGGPVVEHQDRQRRIVLVSEGREALFEPGAGVVRDQDATTGGTTWTASVSSSRSSSSALIESGSIVSMRPGEVIPASLECLCARSRVLARVSTTVTVASSTPPLGCPDLQERAWRTTHKRHLPTPATSPSASA